MHVEFASALLHLRRHLTLTSSESVTFSVRSGGTNHGRGTNTSIDGNSKTTILCSTDGSRVGCWVCQGQPNETNDSDGSGETHFELLEK
jgi:hypothetical protein